MIQNEKEFERNIVRPPNNYFSKNKINYESKERDEDQARKYSSIDHYPPAANIFNSDNKVQKQGPVLV